MTDALTLSSSQVAPGEAVVAVAYNHHGTRMACATAKHGILIYETDGSGTQRFAGEFQATSAGAASRGVAAADTLLAWLHPELGEVLAVSVAGQPVELWREQQGGSAEKAWKQVSCLRDSRAVVRGIAFAPKEFGGQLAVAAADGLVRLYNSSALFSADKWALSGSFQASRGGECTCVAWREASVSGPPPLLVVGTSDRGAVVWCYDEPLMEWQECVTLSKPGCAVTCVHWAPALGRPQELVAIATGSTVEVFSLRGTTDSSMAVSKEAELPAGSRVWKLEWNMLGTALAASTDRGEVLVFNPSLLGKFELTAKFVGQVEASGARDTDMAEA